jgi:hypothetical protein
MRKTSPKEEPLRILFYGMPGSTKTRTSATACNDPRTSPVLYLEAGGNPISLRDYKHPPDIIHIDALEDFNPIYEWFLKGQPADAALVRDMDLHPPFKTLMIDQITDVQRMTMNKASGNMITADMPGTIPNPMQIQHFNATLGHMIKFAKLFFGLPDMHVIITCQEREDKDETTGLISYKPLLWGQSAGEVGGYAYLVSRLVHRTRVGTDAKLKLAIGEMPDDAASVALFMPSGKYIAKDQYGMRGPDGGLLPFMVNPSIPKILDLVYGPAG